MATNHAYGRQRERSSVCTPNPSSIHDLAPVKVTVHVKMHIGISGSVLSMGPYLQLKQVMLQWGSSFQGFLGRAKWISSIHSMNPSRSHLGLQLQLGDAFLGRRGHEAVVLRSTELSSGFRTREDGLGLSQVQSNPSCNPKTMVVSAP